MLVSGIQYSNTPSLQYSNLMKFTLNWLKEFVDFKASPEKLAKLLTMAGLEVESVTPLQEPETNREDWLFEIGVTPNRGDCLGIAGIATRSIRADRRASEIDCRDSPFQRTPAIANRVTLTIEIAASLSSLLGAESSTKCRWARRLPGCGFAWNPAVFAPSTMSSTSPITSCLKPASPSMPSTWIVCRRETSSSAPANEIRKFTTLDGVERELAAEDLLICDGDVPIALAGVMGGMNSEVTTETRSILLESANFDPTFDSPHGKTVGAP